jgi:hypothetical protein
VTATHAQTHTQTDRQTHTHTRLKPYSTDDGFLQTQFFVKTNAPKIQKIFFVLANCMPNFITYLHFFFLVIGRLCLSFVVFASTHRLSKKREEKEKKERNKKRKENCTYFLFIGAFWQVRCADWQEKEQKGPSLPKVGGEGGACFPLFKSWHKFWHKKWAKKKGPKNGHLRKKIFFFGGGALYKSLSRLS